MKALTYGNLGTGGLSTAGFEQTLPDDHPIGRHIPGFGTHTVEHRAIDPAGNYGKTESYKATVLPGSAPACGTTVTGTQATVTVTSGITCLTGATVSGAVTVSGGGTLVASNSTIGGALNATGAEAVQLFGTTVNGAAKIANSTRNVTIAGSAFKGGLALTGNTQITASERYSRLAGAYGPILAGSTVNGTLECSGNSADVKDFGAPNKITRRLQRVRAGAGHAGGAGVRHRPGHAVAHAGGPGVFGAFTPGITKEYTAASSANVISTAGDAALSVSDPGHLANGAFTLAEPLRVEFSKSAWTAPVSNDSGRHRLQAAREGERPAPHGHLQQDADLHAEHHSAVEALSCSRGSAREG